MEKHQKESGVQIPRRDFTVSFVSSRLFTASRAVFVLCGVAVWWICAAIFARWRRGYIKVIVLRRVVADRRDLDPVVRCLEHGIFLGGARAGSTLLSWRVKKFNNILFISCHFVRNHCHEHVRPSYWRRRAVNCSNHTLMRRICRTCTMLQVRAASLLHAAFPHLSSLRVSGSFVSINLLSSLSSYYASHLQCVPRWCVSHATSDGPWQTHDIRKDDNGDS